LKDIYLLLIEFHLPSNIFLVGLSSLVNVDIFEAKIKKYKVNHDERFESKLQSSDAESVLRGFISIKKMSRKSIFRLNLFELNFIRSNETIFIIKLAFLIEYLGNFHFIMLKYVI
jgi:hypothetical protein